MCTGFSGADIFGLLRGEPSTLFMKPESPLFFLHLALPGPEPVASSEYLLLKGLELLSSRGELLLAERSPEEKLADCLSEGVNMPGPGAVCAV
jgi:hypothetical protein